MQHQRVALICGGVGKRHVVEPQVLDMPTIQAIGRQRAEPPSVGIGIRLLTDSSLGVGHRAAALEAQTDVLEQQVLDRMARQPGDDSRAASIFRR